MAKFKRNPLAFLDWFVRLFFVIGRALDNFYWYRFTLGGVWVKMDGEWSQVDVMHVDEDGSRFLRNPETQFHFHETNISISAIETHS